MLPAFLAPDAPRSRRFHRSRRRTIVPATWRVRIRRFRRRPLVYWTVVVVVAATSGLTVLHVTARAEAAASRYGSTVAVPVAARPVAAGTTLQARDVQWRRVPRALLPRVRAARRPAGRVVVSALFPGEVVVEERLAPSGLHGAAALVPAGSRALAVPSGPSTPHVARGDHVDLLSVVADEAAASSVVAAGALVVEVDDQSLTVAVSEQEAPAVAAALARGTVAVALVGVP